MTEAAPARWTRREFGGAAALVALALGLPTAGAVLSGVAADDAPTDRQRAVMRAVSQAVLPRTGTPGAGDVGTGDFVILALAHGLDGTRAPAGAAGAPWAPPEYHRPDGSLRFVTWLEDTLDRRAHGDWLMQPPGARDRHLRALDAEAFGEGRDAHPWRKIKGLILTGYYTSQIGASRELQFELVPGRYDPRLPMDARTRAWSSDWTAVDFG